MKYIYQGYNTDLQSVSGETEAPSLREAVRNLKQQGIQVIISIKRKREFFGKLKKYVSSIIKPRYIYISNVESPPKDYSTDNVIVPSDVPVKQEETVFVKRPIRKIEGRTIPWETFSRPVHELKKIKIKPREINHFTRQLATLLSSGISLSQALLSLGKVIRNKKLQSLINSIYQEIQSGNTLSYALSRYPNQFSRLYLALVAVGETSGALDRCLYDITNFLDTQDKIRSSIKNAMIYPAIIFGVIFVMLVAGSQWFIPMFEKLFISVDMELPALTKAVFWIANHLKYILGSILAVWFALTTLISKVKPLQRNYIVTRDKLFLVIPIVKDFILSVSMFYFASTMSLMLKNGIRIIDSLSLALTGIPNKIIQAEVQDTADLLVNGVSLSEALLQERHFDPVICSIISTGEETGRLDESLAQAANYYAEQLKRQTAALEQWIQPAAIIAIAIIVLPVILAIFLPLLDLTSGKFMKQ